MNKNKLEELVDKIEKMAKELADGHYTVMKFTTGYKGFYTTDITREELWQLTKFTTLLSLLSDMVNNPSDHMI